MSVCVKIVIKIEIEKKKSNNRDIYFLSISHSPNCKSLWIKASAKCINVNVNVLATFTPYTP